MSYVRAWLCQSLIMASYRACRFKGGHYLPARLDGRALSCLTAKGGGLPKLN